MILKLQKKEKPQLLLPFFTILSESFLVEKNSSDFNKDELLKGLKLVCDYMEKSILKPNNISYPVARSNFFNNLKN